MSHPLPCASIVCMEVIFMKQSASFTVIGGDLRQIVLAQLLAKQGNTVQLCACERHDLPQGVHLGSLNPMCTSVTAVILPMPLSRDGIHVNTPLSNTSVQIDALFSMLPAQTVVIAGAVSPAVQALAKKYALQLIDLLDYEQLAILNAVPTAEGALQIAMEELPITLHGARALVMGNGRIGHMLAVRLHALGAQVSVSARSAADFARIRCDGFTPLHSHHLTPHLQEFDLIINTVPAMLLGETALAQVPEDCLLIDLASGAGGVDAAAAKRQGKRLIHALSLPGKVAPITAAHAIFDTVQTIVAQMHTHEVHLEEGTT